MDSRSLIMGLICGALVGVAAGWFLGGERSEDVTSLVTEPTDSAIVADVMTVVPKASNNNKEPVAEVDQKASEPQSSSDTGVDPAEPWPANQRAALELEPKDDSWAYYMEQTLLQFLGAHSSIEQFEISSIECRTTKCQIEVVGYNKSTAPVWTQVMYDIRQQPWSEFGQYGSSSGTINGRLIIVGTLHRKTEAE